MSNNKHSRVVSHSAGPLTANSLWSSTTASVRGKKQKAATVDVLQRSNKPKNTTSSSGSIKNHSSRKLAKRLNSTMREGLDKLFVKSLNDQENQETTIRKTPQSENINSNYFSKMIKNTSSKVIGGSLKESKQKLKDSFLDYVSNHNLLPPPKILGISPSNKNHDENNENLNISTHKPNLSHPKPVHFRKVANSSPIRNTSPVTQNILADAISPSVIGPTNIRFVTTDEREIRDRQVTQALNIISQSMEPPIHNVDKIKDWLLGELRPNEDATEKQQWFYSVFDFFLGVPFTVIRAFWHYVVLELHLVYNLALLYVTFIQTPPIIYFVIGITLFWIKILYELYRDIMHRDDPIYSSEVAKELSIAAAISASMGFILNMKAQAGEINSAWWTGAFAD